MNCQQCKQPLQIDASLVDLTPSAYEMVAGSIPRYGASHASGKYTSASDKLLRTPGQPNVKAVWERSAHERGGSRGLSNQQHRATIAGGESFVLLQDSIIKKIPTTPPSSNFPRGGIPVVGNNVAVGSSKSSSAAGKNKAMGNTNETASPVPLPSHNVPSAPLSHHLRSTLRLYSLLSSKTEVDHPLCDECTHLLIKLLNRRLEDMKKERDMYIGAEKELRKELQKEMTESSKFGSGKAESERQIEALKEEEERAVEEVRIAQRESERLEAELRALELEEKELEEEEAEFWRAHNATMLQIAQQADRLRSFRAAYASDALTLDRLEHTNVYNDAFCIGQEGSVFGTINGLRFGRTGLVDGQTITVEWTEVNAAWGQAILLLYTIARKLNYTFETYALHPLGSFSKVERIADKSVYELYGTGDMALGRLLHNRRFDTAMVIFLDCLRQVMEFVKKEDPSVMFPAYCTINKERIGEHSIKLPFSTSDESWTRALKNVLFALKALLRYATKLAT